MHLLKYFEKLSLKPENANDLKGLILDLAIRGRLTEEWRKDNPDVETGLVLLGKIKEQKLNLINAKKIKKAKPLLNIDNEEVPFELPKHWEWSRFGKISLIIRGITFPKNAKFKVDFPGAIPCLRTANVQKSVDWDDLIYVDRKFVKRPDQFLRSGDILMSVANSRELVGKVCIIDVDLNREFTLGGFISALRTFVDQHYVLHALRSSFARSSMISSASQTTNIANISNSKMNSLVFPVPPLAEQKAIVKIVNQLMAEVDQLESQTKTRVQLRHDFIKSSLRQLTTANSQSEWNKLKPQFTSFFDTAESIDKLKEAILQLAVQGKLTKQWRADNPDVEPASELLERIKVEKARLVAEKKIRKEKPLPEIAKKEISFELPKKWEWFRFQEVFDIRDGTHDSPKDSLDPDSYPLITSKNFKNGSIDFNSARRISEEDYLKVIKRSKVHRGDILFSMIGGNIGNQVEVGEITEFAIKNVALFKHYKYGMPVPGFLRIISKFLAMDLQSQAAGGAQPFVSLKFFRNLIFALPPQEEQNEIIVIVAQLMGYCNQMKTEIESRSLLSKDFLKSSIREVMEKTKSLA